jgi:hypothetical protein
MTGDEVQLAQPDSLVQLAALWGAPDGSWDEDILELEYDGFLVTAAATDGHCRVRVSFDLGPVAAADAAEWVRSAQPLSPAYLEVYSDDAADDRPHVWAAFERPAAAHDWATDPLLKHAAELRDALEQLREVRVPVGDQVLFGDPVGVPPASAWLLMGTGAAVLTEAEDAGMRDEARYGMYENSWTAAKQTAVGDLLMVYFTAPDKAVRYVARAASDAFYSSDIAVNSDREVAQFQWWV